MNTMMVTGADLPQSMVTLEKLKLNPRGPLRGGGSGGRRRLQQQLQRPGVGVLIPDRKIRQKRTRDVEGKVSPQSSDFGDDQHDDPLEESWDSTWIFC